MDPFNGYLLCPHYGLHAGDTGLKNTHTSSLVLVGGGGIQVNVCCAWQILEPLLLWGQAIGEGPHSPWEIWEDLTKERTPEQCF